jgi:hypothetical protein
MESILTSIKNLLGIEATDTNFDVDIIMGINSALFNVNQLAIGPTDGFRITDATTTWSDLLGARIDLEAVKTYIYLKVRLLFDPPQMGYLVESINKQCLELEWRLNVQVESEEE